MGRALVQALRNAGIPVDAIGSVTSGYLFVRTTGRFGKRANTFRWFAAGSSEATANQCLAAATDEMSQRASKSGPPAGPLGSSAGDSAATGSDSY